MKHRKKRQYKKGLAILLTGAVLATAGCGTAQEATSKQPAVDAGISQGAEESDAASQIVDNKTENEKETIPSNDSQNHVQPSEESKFELSSFTSSNGTVISSEFADITSMEEVLAGAVTKVTFTGNSAEITGNGCYIREGILTIEEAGTYLLSGILDNGGVLVDAKKSSEVNLVLDGVTITNEKSAAIFVKKAQKANLYLAEGTVNTLTDGAVYTYASEEETEPNATLYSKADLTISGTGTLLVNANYNDGIAGKDNLALLGGTVKVTATGDGIVGKDYLYVTDGSYELVTGGGADNANTHFSGIDRGFFGGFGSTAEEDSTSKKAFKSDILIHITGGNFVIDSCDDALHSDDTVVLNGGVYTISSGDDGVHAESDLFINQGQLNITKCYEGLEALDITINGGETTIVAEDDGVNAAGTQTQEEPSQDTPAQEFFAGVPDNSNFPEGMGRPDAGGTGGNDASANGFGAGRPDAGRGGMGGFGMGMMEDTNASFTVNGGILKVNANGDGLDANGGILITGGEVYVDGPVNNGNGSMDYATSCIVNGGILVAAGSTGMAQATSNTSSQPAVSYTAKEQKAGTNITITDALGNVLVSYSPAKSFQNVVISAPGMEIGSTVTISVGDTVTETELTEMVTYIGSSNGMGGFGGGNKPGGKGVRP